ncbi:MAG: hypothetical protein LBR32_00160 [Propionibacteriaceae bacterium]|nr:hypothetical protein [Propionibacteriaceae bacterium]
MSADLAVFLPDEARFSADGWVQLAGSFGLGLTFPEGFDLADQSGYLPCRVEVAGRPGVDAGFELDRVDTDTGEPAHFGVSVAAGDTDLDWALALMFALYGVAGCDGAAYDPQEGVEYTADNVPDLEAEVRHWLGLAQLG